MNIYTMFIFKPFPYTYEETFQPVHFPLGGVFIISYTPLWQTMKDKNITQYKLLKSGIDNKTLDSLKKGKNITLNTVEKLCYILNCTPNDIVSFDYDE